MSQPHPRPLLTRPTWQSLNGEWSFAFDPTSSGEVHATQLFPERIQVPYPPESKASGLHREAYCKTVWYRHEVSVPQDWPAGRTLLHFGAVDYHAQVWVNDAFVGTHTGGHTPFAFDVTEQARSGTLRITVRADDDPLAMDQPRGKQDWRPEPHSIWYPRTTGIWQTVWLERVPDTFIGKLELLPDLERWGFNARVVLAGTPMPEARVRLKLSVEGRTLSDDTVSVLNGEADRMVLLPDGGIDSIRGELAWRPEHPVLIDVEAELLGADGTLDRVEGYTAMRSVRVQNGQFLLNGFPYPLRLVLDQGYWPDSLMSATDDELRRDVELTKQLGFNGARKHQKIEDPRYLYWADHLGLLVWEEMPSAYALTDRSVRALTREWLEAIERDRAHPCIVAWVPLNESWGVPDLPVNARAQHLLDALYHLTKAADPSRPVIGNDGWEHGATDILSIHDYTDQPEIIEARYGSTERVQTTLREVQPGHRTLLLDPARDSGQPVMLTEFGGIAFTPDATEGWGYSRARTSEDFVRRYEGLLGAVHRSAPLKGFCYTQLTDTFQEVNGLLNERREFKGDAERLRRATTGERTPTPEPAQPDADVTPIKTS